MSFVTYENHRNKHVTVHKAGCRQIRKNGGVHRHGQGGYHDYETFAAADAYADSTKLPKYHCSFCKPVPSPLD